MFKAYLSRRKATARKFRHLSTPLRLEQLEERNVLSTWTPLATPAPTGIGTMLLLTNGDVMAQDAGETNIWWELTPDTSGSYVNGAWSELANMSASRLYFASNILPNGNVFVQGGEYSSDGSLTNTGETYNPLINLWTPNAPSPGYDNLGNNFGDDPSEVLPNGNILAGYIWGPQTSIYDPSTNAWTQGPTKLNNDKSDEETWVKLPNGDILSYSIFASLNSGNSQAQIYDPNSNSWESTGPVPVQLSDTTDYELGPAMLLPDGRTFQLGANGNTAFYTFATNSWAAGPVIPDGLVTADAPGAMLPNGDVLFAASPPTYYQNGQLVYPGPTTIFEFNPNTGVYTNVTPSDNNLSEASYNTRMLVLPSGQVLFSDGSSQLWVYTPDGTPNSSWQPTISSIQNNNDGSYTLTGTQLNGISEGASYGDDAEMSSNYPIVQITDANNNVYYAETFNWISQVATGSTPVSTEFRMPAWLPAGQYTLRVIANGIASTSVSFTYNVTNVTDYAGLYKSYPAPYGGTWGLLTHTPANGDIVYTADTSFLYGGNPGQVPVVGDWTGDGIDTPGLYNSNNGQWSLLSYVPANGSVVETASLNFTFGGNPGQIPLLGDWFGDGIDTPALYDTNTGEWSLLNYVPANGSVVETATINFTYGDSSAQIPIVGHWVNSSPPGGAAPATALPASGSVQPGTSGASLAASLPSPTGMPPNIPLSPVGFAPNFDPTPTDPTRRSLPRNESSIDKLFAMAPYVAFWRPQAQAILTASLDKSLPSSSEGEPRSSSIPSFVVTAHRLNDPLELSTALQNQTNENGVTPESTSGTVEEVVPADMT